MNILFSIIIDVLEQGLIYGIMSLGVYISFKILNFPDLSVDGTFPLGAAVAAWMLASGYSPWLALPAAIIAGALAGTLTGILHVYGRINNIFSGIITMTMLYSINLIIVGRSNFPLFSLPGLFNVSPAILLPSSIGPITRVVIIAFILALLCKLVLDAFLKSRSGLLLRAAGDNEQVVSSLAIHPGKMKILGLALANGLVALSGCILAQQQGFFEISMGTGTMVMGLASVIMGTQLFRRLFRMKETTMVLIGAFLYKALVAAAINLGAASELLNLIRGLLFFVILIGNHNKKGKKKNA